MTAKPAIFFKAYGDLKNIRLYLGCTPLKMPHLLIILFFCTALFDTSYGQKPKGKKSKETAITKTSDSKQNPTQDTAFLNQLARGSEDSILTIIESLLKDTTFLKSIGDSIVSDYESVSSQYKLQFPTRALGWTSDFEHIFSSHQILELDSLISSFEKETTNEIAIVTIESSWATKESFDSLTMAIAKNWGVGKKHKNNGILIGISTQLRTIRIQNGYGIEAKLTDAETKKIIDDIIIPEFKKGNYFEGTKNGLLVLMQKVR
ncbi:MAG: TPM domain-containing protein [Ferruginibacter sp.]